VRRNIIELGGDQALHALTLQWLIASAKHKYSYNFRWLGRPIIQYPQDMVALQEIVWDYQPDLIIETGVALGGSLVFYASLLQLMGGNGIVVGIDIEVRPHNFKAITEHPLSDRIRLIRGSSTDPNTVEEVRRFAEPRSRILVALDSNHTHDHVLRELELYSPFVRKDGYLVVLDTIVEDIPKSLFPDRQWGPGNNPRTAVNAFLSANDRFEIDRSIEHKLLITVAPGGYLRCVKD